MVIITQRNAMMHKATIPTYANNWPLFEFWYEICCLSAVSFVVPCDEPWVKNVVEFNVIKSAVIVANGAFVGILLVSNPLGPDVGDWDAVEGAFVGSIDGSFAFLAIEGLLFLLYPLG